MFPARPGQSLSRCPSELSWVWGWPAGLEPHGAPWSWWWLPRSAATTRRCSRLPLPALLPPAVPRSRSHSRSRSCHRSSLTSWNCLLVVYTATLLHHCHYLRQVRASSLPASGFLWCPVPTCPVPEHPYRGTPCAHAQYLCIIAHVREPASVGAELV